MLTTIIMSVTATLSPVDSITTSDVLEANKLESQHIVEDRRASRKKLSFERIVEDRRASRKKLSFERVVEDRRASRKKL